MRSLYKIVIVVLLSLGAVAEASAQCTSCTVTINSANGNTNADFWWQTSGTYCIPSGTTYTGNMVIATGATVKICGKFTGNLTIQGGTLYNYGTISTANFTIYTGTLNNYDSINYTGSQLVVNTATFNNYGRVRTTGDLQVTAGTWNQDGTSLRVGGFLEVTNNSSLTVTTGDSVWAARMDVNTNYLTNNSYVRVSGNVKIGSGGTLTNNKTLSIGGDLDNNANFKSTDSVYVAGATKNNAGTFEVKGAIKTAYIYNNATFIADGTQIKIDSLLSNTSGTFTMKNGGKLETKNLENYGTITSSGTGTPVITVTGSSTNTGTLTGNVDFCDYSGAGTPDNNGGTTGGAVTFCNSALPVTWEEFSVRWLQPNTGLLNWTTTHEVDNSHFVILRSINGKNWEEIGKVGGNGTTSESKRYTFQDDYLPFNSSFCYYRIMQVDYSGQKGYSNIVKMDKGAATAELITYTNPASGQLHLNVKAPVKGQVTVKILDLSGREIISQLTTGDIALGHYAVDLSQVPAGIYAFTLENNGELLLNEKLMIQ